MSSKLQDLTSTTSVTGTDILYTVVDPAGTPLDKKITVANMKTSLGLTGTNSGDQTSIVGITGTLAEFNTALTGADFATGGGTITGTSSGTNTGDQTSIVGITGTKAQFDTAVTDGNILYVGDITQYTDEMAQDAVGAMVDSTLIYTDATPLLGINLGNSNTWTADQLVPDDAYDATTWNGNMAVPTKNAIRDKIESMGGGGSPGGSDTQFQYNNASAFGGVSNLTFNNTSGALTFTGSTDTTQLIFKANSTQTTSNPFFKFQDSTGGELGRLHFRNDNAVSLGFAAGDAITSGAGVYIGRNAGGAITTSENIVIGNNAMVSNSSGENTIIGNGAGNGITGATNTIIGSSAGGNFTSASNNVALGSGSLTGSNGAGNTAIGTAALESTSGERNVALGHKAGADVTSGSWNVNIGPYTTSPSNTGTGQLNISNIVFGKNGQSSASTSGTPTGTGVASIGIAASDSSTLTLRGSTTSISSLRITSGTAPSSPVDGDIWYDGTDIKMRVGGTTKTFTLI